MDHKRVIVRIARPGRLRLLLAERVRVTPVPMDCNQQQEPLHAEDVEQDNNQKRTKLDVTHVLPEKSRQAMLGAPTVTMERNQKQDGPRAKDAEQDNSQKRTNRDAKPVVTDFSRQETTGADVVQKHSKQQRTKRDASCVVPDGTRYMVS